MRGMREMVKDTKLQNWPRKLGLPAPRAHFSGAVVFYPDLAGLTTHRHDAKLRLSSAALNMQPPGLHLQKLHEIDSTQSSRREAIAPSHPLKLDFAVLLREEELGQLQVGGRGDLHVARRAHHHVNRAAGCARSARPRRFP